MSERTCPGMPDIGWPLHSVDSDEELYEGRCYDCATALGIDTGDELAKMGPALARMETER
jgi:hypothetical protein